MKHIENISPSLEKILSYGLEKSEKTSEIILFQSSITLYYFENTVFVIYRNINNYSKKAVVSLFEVKNTESYYLFNSINQIIDDLDIFGEDEKRKETFDLYTKVISYCKQISFDCTDFKNALEKIR